MTARFNKRLHYRGSEGLSWRDHSIERKMFWAFIVITLQPSRIPKGLGRTQVQEFLFLGYWDLSPTDVLRIWAGCFPAPL